MARPTYQPKDFHLAGLTGISDRTLEVHFGLYKGYVTNTNLLTEQLTELSVAKSTPASKLAYAELTRRLGFEYGGMVLHEYYFGNLATNGQGQPSPQLQEAITQSFGSFATWKEDFVAVGSLRGVGWAILYQDPPTRQLSNHWVELHHHSVPSGFQPLLVMDVWEHAFFLDYKPAERGKYIDAFFANVDWTAVNARHGRIAVTEPFSTHQQ